MKILIADDDALPRRLLEAVLLKWDYEVISVGDGEEAWQILQSDDAPRLAILDWLMPGMDGPEICRRVRDRSITPYVYLVLLTSKDSKEDVVAGLDAGADDYLTKPFHRHELQVRLRAGRRILDLQAALLQSLGEVRRAEEQVAEAHAREVETGAKIQQTLLFGKPPHRSTGGHVAALTIPSQQIDGDFYDFLTHGDGCLDVIVGDVMGKGVPAALMGAAIKSNLLRAVGQLQSASPQGVTPTPEEIVSSVHAQVTGQFIALERFATLCYARFDIERHQVDFVDCGHTKPIHFHQRTGECENLEHGQNMPLGFSESEVYVQVSHAFETGDVFLFYSDGVTEAQNAHGQMFGRERLIKLLKKNSESEPETLVQAVRDAVVAFSGSESFADDLTCVAIRIGDIDRRVSHDVYVTVSRLSQLEPLREFVRRFCLVLAPPLDEDFLSAMELAVTEAFSNIVRHAYDGQPDKRIHVTAEAYVDHICIELSHDGKPFDPNSAPPPKFDGTREGGLGVFMIAQSVDDVRYTQDDRGTNKITLIKLRQSDTE